MLLAVTNDLMASAPIEHAARQLGIACRVATSESLVGLVLQDPPEVVVVDLTAADDVATLIRDIRHVACEPVPIVAFGPHVHASKLDSARQAGCTEVLTRGQFHRDITDAIEKQLQA